MNFPFWKKRKPDAKLWGPQLIERLRRDVRIAVNAATEGQPNRFALMRQIADALHSEAQAVEMRLAMTRPVM